MQRSNDMRGRLTHALGACAGDAGPTSPRQNDRRLPGLDDLLQRARAEYGEMPGLCLTASQARRLWDLDPATCETVLDTLVDARFLVRTPQGAFVRADTELRLSPAPMRRLGGVA